MNKSAPVQKSVQLQTTGKCNRFEGKFLKIPFYIPLTGNELCLEVSRSDFAKVLGLPHEDNPQINVL